MSVGACAGVSPTLIVTDPPCHRPTLSPTHPVTRPPCRPPTNPTRPRAARTRRSARTRGRAGGCCGPASWWASTGAPPPRGASAVFDGLPTCYIGDTLLVCRVGDGLPTCYIGDTLLVCWVGDTSAHYFAPPSLISPAGRHLPVARRAALCYWEHDTSAPAPHRPRCVASRAAGPAWRTARVQCAGRGMASNSRSRAGRLRIGAPRGSSPGHCAGSCWMKSRALASQL